MERMMQRILKRILMWALLVCLLTAPAMAEDMLRFGAKGDDSISRGNCLPLSNGNLLVSMQSQGGLWESEQLLDRHSMTWLFCLEPDGSILWKTPMLEQDGSFLFYSMLELEDGSVMGVAIYIVAQSYGYSQMRRYSLENGELLWEGERKPFDYLQGEEYDMIYALPASYIRLMDEPNTEDGGFVYTYQNEDAEGNILWRTQIKDVVIPEAYMSLPGGTLVVSSQVDRSVSEYGTHGFATLIKDDGTAAWQTVVPAPSGKKLSLTCAAPTGDGGVILAGYMLDTTTFSGTLPLVSLSLDTGDIRWYRDLPELGGHGVRTIAALEDGYLMGTSGISGEMNFLKIDKDGHEILRWKFTMEDIYLTGPNLFRWNDRVWMQAGIDEDGHSDALICPVEIP